MNNTPLNMTILSKFNEFHRPFGKMKGDRVSYYGHDIDLIQMSSLLGILFGSEERFWTYDQRINALAEEAKTMHTMFDEVEKAYVRDMLSYMTGFMKEKKSDSKNTLNTQPLDNILNEHYKIPLGEKTPSFLQKHPVLGKMFAGAAILALSSGAFMSSKTEYVGSGALYADSEDSHHHKKKKGVIPVVVKAAGDIVATTADSAGKLVAGTWNWLLGDDREEEYHSHSKSSKTQNKSNTAKSSSQKQQPAKTQTNQQNTTAAKKSDSLEKLVLNPFTITVNNDNGSVYEAYRNLRVEQRLDRDIEVPCDKYIEIVSPTHIHDAAGNDMPVDVLIRRKDVETGKIMKFMYNPNSVNGNKKPHGLIIKPKSLGMKPGELYQLQIGVERGTTPLVFVRGYMKIQDAEGYAPAIIIEDKQASEHEARGSPRRKKILDRLLPSRQSNRENRTNPEKERKEAKVTDDDVLSAKTIAEFRLLAGLDANKFFENNKDPQTGQFVFFTKAALKHSRFEISFDGLHLRDAKEYLTFDGATAHKAFSEGNLTLQYRALGPLGLKTELVGTKQGWEKGTSLRPSRSDTLDSSSFYGINVGPVLVINLAKNSGEGFRSPAVLKLSAGAQVGFSTVSSKRYYQRITTDAVPVTGTYIQANLDTLYGGFTWTKSKNTDTEKTREGKLNSLNVHADLPLEKITKSLKGVYFTVQYTHPFAEEWVKTNDNEVTLNMQTDHKMLCVGVKYILGENN